MDGSPVVVQVNKGGSAGRYGGPYASRICALGANRPLEVGRAYSAPLLSPKSTCSAFVNVSPTSMPSMMLLNISNDIPITEYISAWRPQARACNLRGLLVCQASRRAPSSLIASRIDDLSLVSRNLALAGDPAVHQLTEAPLILHSGFRPIDVQSPRILRCRRCKDQHEQTPGSTRASQ